MNNPVAVSPKEFDMPSSTVNIKGRTIKNKNDKVAQQKPESTPLIVPMAPNPVMPTTKSQTSVSRAGGGGNDAKAIPSKNPKISINVCCNSI